MSVFYIKLYINYIYTVLIKLTRHRQQVLYIHIIWCKIFVELVAVTSPSTPVSGRLSNVPSPSSQTTPTAISSNQLSRRIMSTPENPLLSHQTSPYMVATGPSTPVQTYIGWGGTPVTPGNDGSGLHPLQRALMLQNQYSQVQRILLHYCQMIVCV